MLSGGGRSLGAKISGGKGSSLGNMFWSLQNQTHFAVWQCKLHRATCRRFDTIPACDRRTDGRTDGQTDGIAVASTTLAMRRAAKIDTECVYFTTMAARSHSSPEILTLRVCGGVDDVITGNKFHENRSWGFRATGVRKLGTPIDLACHPYNSSALPC